MVMRLCLLGSSLILGIEEKAPENTDEVFWQVDGN